MTSLAVRPVAGPDQLALFADSWTTLNKPFADRFRDACERVARAHGGDVDPNLVRAELINEPDYDPRRYSAMWSPACGRDGFLVKTDIPVPISGEGSRGNGGKDVFLRRWVGDRSPERGSSLALGSGQRGRGAPGKAPNSR